jgi:type II secretory pathway pseudopilin PulG
MRHGALAPDAAVQPAGGTAAVADGYIMVVLLVAMAVSAVWMGAALPAWRQQVVREKEAELIFRGEQYARAIYLYRQKNGNQVSPPNIDVLVSQKYLRKKYLDPITGKDFLTLGGAGAVGATAGITGVRSTSNDASIVTYRNQQVYSQFPFDWPLEAQKAGASTQQQGQQPQGRTGQQGGRDTGPAGARSGGVGGAPRGGQAPAPPPGGRGTGPAGGVGPGGAARGR